LDHQPVYHFFKVNMKAIVKKKLGIVLHTALLLLIASGGFAQNDKSAHGHEHNPWYSNTDTTTLTVSDAAWKKILPADLYAVAREKATERAFTGTYWKSTTKGTYYCAVCGNLLFRSDAKFASSCGWPSFYEPGRATAVRYQADDSAGMERTEVLCGRCQSHLGHIFDDGPPPTHKRFCMNSISLDFEPGLK
jgi:peptide-methionine (R)-S-oxide reductase